MLTVRDYYRQQPNIPLAGKPHCAIAPARHRERGSRLSSTAQRILAGAPLHTQVAL
jgi:hypothetical protein